MIKVILYFLHTQFPIMRHLELSKVLGPCSKTLRDILVTVNFTTGIHAQSPKN